MQHSIKNQRSSKFQQQPIDFARLLTPILKYWYLFVLSIGISIAAALFYLRHLTPIYEVQSTILIQNNEENGLTRDALQKELLGMGSESKVYEDARILKSRTLMQQVVDSLNLQHRLVQVERFRTIDLFQNSPIDLAKVTVPNRPGSYEIKILNQSEYRLRLDELKEIQASFGVPINTKEGTFLLHLNTENSTDLDTAVTYLLQTNSLSSSAKSYLGALAINYDKNQSTLLDIYIRDEVPERGEKILNELVIAYNRLKLEDKSRNRKNTLNFIDERIALLSKELNQVELELERYKSKEKLTIDYKSDLPYVQERIGYFEKEMVNVEIQKNIIDYIATALNDNEYQFFPLTNFGIENNGLSDLISEYNSLVQEKNKLKQSVTDDYPAVQLIGDKLVALKISIQEEVTKNQRELQTTKSKLTQKSEEYTTQLKATPRRERELVDKKRQQLIKENLYKFLLEKREEAALSVAAVAENASVIDAPFLAGKVYPNRSSTLLGAIIGGFMLPFGALLLFSLMDTRLRNQEEWTSYTDVPVLGSIVRARGNRGGSRLAIQADNHSPTAESFRALRTNLDFFLEGFNQQVILVTSSSIEEGKSFTTINLGMSYALSDQKVLLIDFDLYNPKMLNYLGLNNSELGISDHLAGQVPLSEVIYAYPENENLHYISSGTLPSNPSELLMSDRLPALLEKMKMQYDVIILDSPAAGLVSDSLRLSKFVNASLYVARVGVTEREDLKIIERLHKEGKLTKPALVFNGIKKGRIYKKAVKKGYYMKETKLLSS